MTTPVPEPPTVPQPPIVPPPPAPPVPPPNLWQEPGPAQGPPRIVPSSPRPTGSRLVTGLLVGLLVGLVLFGSAGYLAGANLAHPAPAASHAPNAPTATATGLPVFERNQLALNRDKVKGDLALLASSWLPYLSSCVNSEEKGGPKLNAGEAFRVGCKYGGVSVTFVQYASVSDRDKSRARRVQWNTDAKQTMPGVADPTDKRTTSGNTHGNYLEYGFKSSDDSRVLAGLWWDNTDTPVAAYLVADWHDVLGENWAPLRDLWQRYS